MAADAMVFYNSWKEFEGDGTADMDDDVFKVLLTSSSYTPDATNHTQISDITNELSGNGYARQTAAATWTRSGGTVTFDLADVTFTASGGALTARYAVIFDDTSTGDKLVGYILMDNAPADVSVSDGQGLQVVFHASGVYTKA